MLEYYICESCRFQFVRHSDVKQCPDCGKEAVRKASQEEADEFIRIQEELKREYENES